LGKITPDQHDTAKDYCVEMDIFSVLVDAIMAGDAGKLMEEIDHFLPSNIPISAYDVHKTREQLQNNPAYHMVSETEIRAKLPYVRHGEIMSSDTFMEDYARVWTISYGTLKYGIIHAKYSKLSSPTITIEDDTSSRIVVEFGIGSLEFKKVRPGFPEARIVSEGGVAFYIPDVGSPTVNHSLKFSN
jgi:hypothetical protein